MSKRSVRLWDDERTELLNQPELLVEKGKGDQNYFVAWLAASDVDACPLCNGKEVKIQNLFSKTYIDLIDDGKNQYAISLEYKFYKWRCLNAQCRHIFAKAVNFATKYGNVTRRMESEIVRRVTKGESYGSISEQFNGKVSRQAIGQIFNRCVRTCDEQHKSMYTPNKLGVISGSLHDELYVVFLNLDNDIKVFDVLYGVEFSRIVSVLRCLDVKKVEYVITDFDPVVASAVKDCFPDAIHIIPVDYWFGVVGADFLECVRYDLRWCNVRDKEKILLMPMSELGFHTVDLEKILNSRPEIKQKYVDFNCLRELLTNREVLWIYDELVEWIGSVDDEFYQALFTTKYLLEYYELEIQAHMYFREVVPELLYKLTSWLEECLNEHPPFSQETLAAKVLYAPKNEVQSWQGVPMEKVIGFLIGKDLEE